MYCRFWNISAGGSVGTNSLCCASKRGKSCEAARLPQKMGECLGDQTRWGGKETGGPCNQHWEAPAALGGAWPVAQCPLLALPPVPGGGWIHVSSCPHNSQRLCSQIGKKNGHLMGNFLSVKFWLSRSPRMIDAVFHSVRINKHFFFLSVSNVSSDFLLNAIPLASE